MYRLWPLLLLASVPSCFRSCSRDANHFVTQGISLDKKGEYDKAIVQFDKALSIDPQSAPALMWRGHAWHSKGDYDEAIADYGAVLRIQPNLVRAYSARSNASTFPHISFPFSANLRSRVKHRFHVVVGRARGSGVPGARGNCSG
ncbi:MAG: tetratricopeptide repeat protein [Thermoguttaceae bacterium]